eukprot:4363747-Karenia_brevis.AAC.1
MDKVNSKVEESLAVAKEAKAEATAANQNAAEAKLGVGRMEPELNTLKADVEALKSGRLAHMEGDGLKQVVNDILREQWPSAAES